MYTGAAQGAGGQTQVGGEGVSSHVADGGGGGGGRRRGRDEGRGQHEDGDAAAEVEHAVAHVARHEEETAGQLCQPPTGLCRLDSSIRHTGVALSGMSQASSALASTASRPSGW